MNNIFNINVDSISLIDNYRSRGIKEKISDHISNVYYLASNYDEKIKDLFSSEFKLSNYEYSCDLIKEKNSCYADFVYENDDRINQFEFLLFKRIKENLGALFDYKDKYLLKLIDTTIEGYVENCVFNSLSSKEINPFESIGKILSEEEMLFAFDNYSDEFREFSKKKLNESAIIEGKKISVLTKCNNKKYNYSEIKDTFYYRNLILEELKSTSRNCSNPIKRNELYEYFRKLGVSEDELSNSNIYNWIIRPLKRYSKLGSNRDGYFVILNHEDLLESYISHYNTYNGFFKTLENHRRMYDKITVQDDLGIAKEFFEKHI